MARKTLTSAAREKHLAALDARVPEAAAEAFKEAFEAALETGQPVTVIEGVHLVEVKRVNEKETRRCVSNGVAQSHRVTPGATFTL